jgi:hypothetical protein
MFECSLDRNELPDADPSYAQYTCGSGAANQALVLWAVCIALLVCWAALYWFFGRRGGEGVQLSFMRKWLSEFFGLNNNFMDIHPELPVVFPRVAYFHRVYCNLRRLVLVVTMVVVFVFLPVYIVIHSVASSSGTSFWKNVYSEDYVRILRLHDMSINFLAFKNCVRNCLLY